MMPPFLNPQATTTGKSLETLQTELRKVSVADVITSLITMAYISVTCQIERSRREDGENQ